MIASFGLGLNALEVFYPIKTTDKDHLNGREEYGKKGGSDYREAVESYVTKASIYRDLRACSNLQLPTLVNNRRLDLQI